MEISVKTRVQAKHSINTILRNTTAGFHRDDFWAPVQASFDNIRAAGFDLEVQNTKYGQDESGNPNQKVWVFEINLPFSKKPLYGVLTAHGAGTVADPLSRYDISAYVS